MKCLYCYRVRLMVNILKMKKVLLLLVFLFSVTQIRAQEKVAKEVNVFLGTSGDHGQLSPAASYPFSMISIGPQTLPHTHPGYEYYAKKYIGFTHNRMEGVGCRGDGGNLLIRPYSGDFQKESKLIKKSQKGEPGYYAVSFKNGIQAEFTVNKKLGVHHYKFSNAQNGLYVNFGFALENRFVEGKHHFNKDGASGFIRSGTTCSRGIYKIYYALKADVPLQWKKVGNHQFLAKFPKGTKEVTLKVGFSSVDTSHAKRTIGNQSFSELRNATRKAWNQKLGRIKVKGDHERKKLFYSLLYRVLQSPYVISEKDGSYRAIDGKLEKSKKTYYNGWSIWDNYKTQLPLLSFAYPDDYQNMVWSIAEMYKHGKEDFSTDHEPSQTVRTEHADVVLLDASKKGYQVDFHSIIDSLVSENERLDYGSPDKALESSYDNWALSEIYQELGRTKAAEKYKNKARQYRSYWKKDFADPTKNDVDRVGARGMYQGTVRQYRWLVPYDIKGLKALCGGEDAFIAQLDEFFGKNNYNQANEPDIQAPWLYFATHEPYKSEKLIHDMAIDTVTQFYFNGNFRGIDPYIGRVFKNQPKAFLRTMDDDAGAMSAWFVLAAVGISPALVGRPVYYLHVPLFKKVVLNNGTNHPFKILVTNYKKQNIYIDKVFLNGKELKRNWITQKEIMKGGTLRIKASNQPNKSNDFQPWVSELGK